VIKCCLIIANQEDTLSNEVIKKFQKHRTSFIHVVPDKVGDLAICLKHGQCLINNSPVDGIFYRASLDSSFCGSFVAEDQNYCSAEIRATLLAAMHTESIMSINLYDATAWFEGGNWLVWRRILIKEGMKLSPYAFGDIQRNEQGYWHPYASWSIRGLPGNTTMQVMGSAMAINDQSRSSIIVCGKVIDGKELPSVLQSAQILEKQGIRIAQLMTDSEERIVAVNTQPIFLDSESAQKAAELIVEAYDYNLHSG
jgi:hypothetical protein